MIRILATVWLAAAVAGQPLEHFESKVRPVLVEKCYACHGPKLQSPMGGLRVDSREGLLKGGDHGPAIVPGAPEGSRLIQAVKGLTISMPPNGKLTAAEIGALENWIAGGAPWPTEGPKAAERSGFLNKARHWAYEPITRQTGPVEKHLGRLSPEADARTLRRRLHYDLTGLPPAPVSAGESYEHAVDRLLASPAFGGYCPVLRRRVQQHPLSVWPRVSGLADRGDQRRHALP
jgi:hypothetical protein